MKYKVLHVVGGMNKGGTETMLMNIYRKINRDRIQFDFLYFTDEETYYDKEIIELGGKIIRIHKMRFIHMFDFISNISQVINSNGPYKVVHAHTLFNCGLVVKVAKKSNIDIRISHAHTTLDNENGILRKLYIKIMRNMILKYSTNLLSCSNLAGKYLFGEDTVKSSKYDILPNLISYENIINIDENKVYQLKKINELNSDNLILGNIGTLKEAKNQQFLLDIVYKLKEKNKNVKLLLVGSGPLEENLREKCEKLGIENEVIFTGTRDDIDVILNSMDVFVFPSTFEGLGLVLLEAQAAGLPCVVSEAIQPEADLQLGLFNKLNLSDGADIWSNKIIEVCGKKETDKQKILDAFDKQGYSTEKCISKLLSIYKID